MLHRSIALWKTVGLKDSVLRTTREFSKKRLVVDEAYRSISTEKSNVIKLNPYNKIKKIWKLSHLPESHVLKALSTKEGKYYYTKDEFGKQHVFDSERDIIVPYAVAESYLKRCKKECECVEIDPENIIESQNSNCKMMKKQSVISVVGEMDHGKTTLLDTLLNTNYQKQEFGGTTQLIRANEVSLTHQSSSHFCTFLDTPGQSCFSYIRENGSVLSDFSLYVVSLFEGPTDEAHMIFKQLKENGVPVFILFTKQDLVSPDREKQVIHQIQQLVSQYEVPLMDMQSISCVSGAGIDDLKSKLIHYCQTTQQEVPANLPAEATLLDSSLIPSQGIVFKALIQRGVLSIRDPFICGLYTGNVRSLIDLHSKPIQKAYPGMVVNILGARKLPANLRKTIHLLPTGDTLFVRSSKEIEAIWDQRFLEYSFRSSVCEESPEEEPLTGATEIINGEEYLEVKMNSVIVVADNANSMSILLDEMAGIPGINIVHTRIGQITTSDIEQCRRSSLRIVSFNVPLPEKVRLEKKFIHSRIMSDLLEEVKTQLQ